MNNLFIEGPIQTGKSTLIRKVLRERFGPSLEGVAGFTSQRIFAPGSVPDIQNGMLVGFRLAPANAVLNIAADPAGLDNVFKQFTPEGTRVDMSVFETAGIRFMDEALAAAKAGHAKLILLDEIGGHELASEPFRRKLYELLDSEYPCVGVIKSPDNTRRMDPALVRLNAALHEHLTVMTDRTDFARALSQLIIN